MTGVGPKLAQKIGRARLDIDAASELELCRRLGVRIVARGEPEYPPALENIPDPPGSPLREGTLESKDELAIALVGSRRCTPYGERMAERLAGGLARTGFTIVSGLARRRRRGPPGCSQCGGPFDRRACQRAFLDLSARAR